MIRGTACFLCSAAWVFLLGCGGRTDTLLDADGVGGSSSAGALDQGGVANVGGGFSGSENVGGGGVDPGGGAGFGGATNPGGGAGFAGAINPSGGADFGGASGFTFGGSTGFGGASVIVDTCVSLAPTSCEKCLCQTCSSQVVTCFSDPNCIVLFACFSNTHCQGLACDSPFTCGPVIKQSGVNALNEIVGLATCSLKQTSCGCN
jgi:hypothetical protein